MGKWKSRIWKNTDAKTETETNPEVDILTGSATEVTPEVFYFTSFPPPPFFYFLFSFTSYCYFFKRQPTKSLLKAEFWPATVVCSVWEASPP